MAVKTCKHCGESNTEHALVCTVCSSSLRDVQAEGTPNDSKEYTLLNGAQTKIACWHCKELSDRDAIKCKYCGSTLVKQTTDTRYYYPVEEEGIGFGVILLYIVTLFIPLIGLIVGGIYVFNDDPDKRGRGTALLLFAIGVIVLFYVLGVFEIIGFT
ncbi:double zinc ribbon domain-containing protein [Paenibacillus marinisediminis]